MYEHIVDLSISVQFFLFCFQLFSIFFGVGFLLAIFGPLRFQLRRDGSAACARPAAAAIVLAALRHLQAGSKRLRSGLSSSPVLLQVATGEREKALPPPLQEEKEQSRARFCAGRPFYPRPTADVVPPFPDYRYLPLGSTPPHSPGCENVASAWCSHGLPSASVCG